MDVHGDNVNNIDVLIEKYIEAVIIHGKESWGGDYKKANRYYKILTKCFIDICKHGEEGKNALKQLLSHSNHFVRYSAAYHLLPFEADVSIRVLKKCRKEPDGVGFNARITISEWKNGNLKFPVEKEGKTVFVSVSEFLSILNYENNCTSIIDVENMD